MNESIIKTDGRGRLRFTPEQKKTLVDAYRASGLSAPRFALQHGVNYQTLVYWIKKDKIQDTDPSPRPNHSPLLSLVPAGIDPSFPIGAERGMEVLLPGGPKLVISAPSHVTLAAALIREPNVGHRCILALGADPDEVLWSFTG
jgi:hypothetical protein